MTVHVQGEGPASEAHPRETRRCQRGTITEYHLKMAIICCYMAMLLTDWGVPDGLVAAAPIRSGTPLAADEHELDVWPPLLLDAMRLARRVRVGLQTRHSAYPACFAWPCCAIEGLPHHPNVCVCVCVCVCRHCDVRLDSYDACHACQLRQRRAPIALSIEDRDARFQGSLHTRRYYYERVYRRCVRGIIFSTVV